MPGGAVAVRPVSAAGQRVREQCGGGAGWQFHVTPAEVRVGEGGWALPAAFLDIREAVRKFEVRASDVWLIGCPKSGTTWAQEMVWLLANDCDMEAARRETTSKRFTYFERSVFKPDQADAYFAALDAVPRHTRRFFKTHLALELLPEGILEAGCKVVYISRDPRAAAVSLFHNYRGFVKYTGSLDDFIEAVVADEVLFAPMLEHVKLYRAREGCPNLLLLTYEDMKKDLRGELRRTARFLGVDVEAGVEDAVLEYLSFGAMKANPAVNFQHQIEGGPRGDNAFIRKGEAGSWRAELSADQARRLDEWSGLGAAAAADQQPA